MIQRYDQNSTLARAVVCDNIIYFCGHVGTGVTIKEQTKTLLSRYDKYLEEYNTSKENILFATVFIADLRLKEEMNGVWDSWIPKGDKPARVCVEVGLPEGILLEISLVAKVVD